jgi:thiamine transport system permease protein
MLNLPMAGLLSMIQLLFTLGLTVWYSRLSGRLVVPSAPGGERNAGRRPRGWRERLAVTLMAAGLFGLLVTPLVALGMRSVARLDAARGQRGEVQTGLTLAYYQELFVNRQQSIFYVPPIAAARNSLLYAVMTLAVTLPLGFLAAYALKRPSRLNRWLDPLFMLPLGTSAVTLGLGFILVFNRPPLDLRSFPWLVPIAHSLVALPFVVRNLQPALGAIPAQLRHAASVLGANPWQVWWEIDLPIVARAVLGSAIFAFAISLGEFGATTFLARPDYPTLPVAIYRFLSQPGAMNYGQAMAMATLLMVFTSVSILVIERFHLPGGNL